MLWGGALYWTEGASTGPLPLKGERGELGLFIFTQKSFPGQAVF